MPQHTLFQTAPHFDGETYDKSDQDRLRSQLERVRKLMSDGKWHTLGSISIELGYPEASVSARLRDLRKPKFGGHTVERKHMGRGLWLYRMPT